MGLKRAGIALFFLSLSSLCYGSQLDGSSFDCEFQFDSSPPAQAGTLEFKNGAIISSIHKSIIDKENQIYAEEAARDGSPVRPMTVPGGAPYTDQTGDQGINFTGRIEGFPPIYWSGSVKGEEIEGNVTVESFMGGYMIPFTGKKK